MLSLRENEPDPAKKNDHVACPAQPAREMRRGHGLHFVLFGVVVGLIVKAQ